MKLEEFIVKDGFIGDRKTLSIDPLLRNMLSAFRARQELIPLLVEACWTEFASRRGSRAVYPQQGIVLFEMRMMGLVEPTLMVGLPEGAATLWEPRGRPVRLILAYVGNPMPSQDERRRLSRLKSALRDDDLAMRLGNAKTFGEVVDVLQAFDPEYPKLSA